MGESFNHVGGTVSDILGSGIGSFSVPDPGRVPVELLHAAPRI